MRWPGAGTRSPEQRHDVARQETGEPYTAARREVIKNYQEAGAWTSLAARCDQPPALHFRPGESSGYTLAEAAGW
jgi:hypothetical protein